MSWGYWRCQTLRYWQSASTLPREPLEQPHLTAPAWSKPHCDKYSGRNSMGRLCSMKAQLGQPKFSLKSINKPTCRASRSLHGHVAFAVALLAAVLCQLFALVFSTQAQDDQGGLRLQYSVKPRPGRPLTVLARGKHRPCEVSRKLMPASFKGR